MRTLVYTFHTRSAATWHIRTASPTKQGTRNIVNGHNADMGGGILLLGDAAHILPPFTGQGLCAGLRDAFNLSWKLHFVINKGAHPSILDSYESERRPHVEWVKMMSGLLGTMIMVRHPFLARMRNWLAYTLQSSRAIVNFINDNDIFRPLSYYDAGLLGTEWSDKGRKSSLLTTCWKGLKQSLRLEYTQVGNIFPQPLVRVLTEDSPNETRSCVGRVLSLDSVLARDGRFSMVISTGEDRHCAIDETSSFCFRLWKRIGLKVILVGNGVTSELRNCMDNGIDVTCVEDFHGKLTNYFDTHRCTAALIRPDRFIFALLDGSTDQMAKSAEELDRCLFSPNQWNTPSSRKKSRRRTALAVSILLLLFAFFICWYALRLC